jgi:hypothetical protein
MKITPSIATKICAVILLTLGLVSIAEAALG